MSMPGRGCPASTPAAAEPLTCLYTTTPDHHFVIDRVGPITVAAGFSGHGFKFGPALGDLVVGPGGGAAAASLTCSRCGRSAPWSSSGSTRLTAGLPADEL